MSSLLVERDVSKRFFGFGKKDILILEGLIGSNVRSVFVSNIRRFLR